MHWSLTQATSEYTPPVFLGVYGSRPADAKPPFQPGDEYPLPASWWRTDFLKRWAYTRQMRADPRLIAVITIFTQRIRRPIPQPAPVAVQETIREVRLQTTLERQITTNPVVQEVIKMFRAVLTDITLIPHATKTPATLWGSGASSPTEHLANVEKRLATAEQQLQHRNLEKETLRRQVQQLGGDPCV